MLKGSIPLYHGNKDFILALEKSLLFPVRNPSIFNNELVPVRRTLGVYGREGMRKADVVQTFCASHAIPCQTIKVELGLTSVTANAFNEYVERRSSAILNGKVGLEVIIIDRADILAFEPSDDITTTNFALQLEEKAKLANFIVVCLFDRIYQDEEPSAYRKRFFKQFIYVALLNSPPPDFRAKFFEHVITSFLGSSSFTTTTFTEGDYLKLADASSHATIDDMLACCKDVFYNYMFDAWKGETVAFSFDHFSATFVGRDLRLIPTVAANANQLEERLSASVLGIMFKASAKPVVAAAASASASTGPAAKPMKREASPEASPRAEKKHKQSPEEGTVVEDWLE